MNGWQWVPVGSGARRLEWSTSRISGAESKVQGRSETTLCVITLILALLQWEVFNVSRSWWSSNKIMHFDDFELHEFCTFSSDRSTVRSDALNYTRSGSRQTIFWIFTHPFANTIYMKALILYAQICTCRSAPTSPGRENIISNTTLLLSFIICKMGIFQHGQFCNFDGFD